MSDRSAFNDEKGGSSSVGEPEYGHDPASGGIFSSDYKRSVLADLSEGRLTSLSVNTTANALIRPLVVSLEMFPQC
ncbi:hypothetical protein PAMP_020075 [Pampus punctatissimus]